MADREQVTRGDLLHWYKPGHAHFVTYRLADSIPWLRLKQWRAERERRLKQHVAAGFTATERREAIHKEFFAQYDAHLDEKPNAHWLERALVANIVRENLYHHCGQLYELIAWCVMPNHVHVVLQPFEFEPPEADAGSIGHENADLRWPFSDEIVDSRSPLSRIMHALKSYTANRANEVLGRTGQFWQRESYDHWIRDVDELQRIVEYIQANPVQAGLCRQAHQWKYSSSFDRFQKVVPNEGLWDGCGPTGGVNHNGYSWRMLPASVCRMQCIVPGVFVAADLRGNDHGACSQCEADAYSVGHGRNRVLEGFDPCC